jgi:hypothetical protein
MDCSIDGVIIFDDWEVMETKKWNLVGGNWTPGGHHLSSSCPSDLISISPQVQKQWSQVTMD